MKKIVLIGCDEHFGSNIKAHLVKLGYSVECVCRPCAVAHTLRTFRPDIVLTDRLTSGTKVENPPYTLHKPGTDAPNFKLVLLCSSCDEAGADMVKNGEADACLDRGMPLDKLSEAIQSLYN